MYIMETVYYSKWNISIFEQNSDRQDNNICQGSDLQSTFCRTESVNNMGIKLYHNLPSHLKNKQFLEGM